MKCVSCIITVDNGLHSNNKMYCSPKNVKVTKLRRRGMVGYMEWMGGCCSHLNRGD